MRGGDRAQTAADFEAAALAVHIDTRVARYVLVAGGLVALVNFLFAMNAPDVGLEALLLINTLTLYIEEGCLFTIGYGMYKGRSELAAQQA